MAIIDSVRKLAEKVGADTNGRTIADQLNIINQKLDNTQPGSRDISEAVSKFADKEDGTAILITKTITENKTYKASDEGASGYSSVTVNVAAPTPETFEVELTLTTDYSDAQNPIFRFTSNKTYSEVMSAINSNKTIIFDIESITILPDTTTQSFDETVISYGVINLSEPSMIQISIAHLNQLDSLYIANIYWAADSQTFTISEEIPSYMVGIS